MSFTLIQKPASNGWINELSEEFPILQGVKQEDYTDLYKIYLGDLLDNFQHEESGCIICTLTINAIACADDIALTSHTKEEMQNLVNISPLLTETTQKRSYSSQATSKKEKYERHKSY